MVGADLIAVNKMKKKSDTSKKIWTLDLVRKNQFFADFTPEQMQIVALYWKVIKLSEGKELFKEGDAPDYMYYILKGKLDVIKECEENGKKQQVKVTELSQDTLLGELAIIDGAKRSATVVATADTAMLGIHKKHFDLLVKSRPEIGVVLIRKVAKLISERLKNTTDLYASTQLLRGMV